jgi:hypothetical protein
MTEYANRARRPASRLIWTTVVLHAGLVAFLAVVGLLGAALASPHSNNVGAGLAILALIGLGTPWSEMVIARGVDGTFAALTVIVVCALANLGAHAAIVAMFARRR